MSLLRTVFSRRTLAYVSGGTALTVAGGYWYLNSGPAYPLSTLEKRRPPPPWTPPSRDEMLKALKASGAIKTPTNSGEEFDLLIVGGGATGAGVAVDAASRGLKVALVERDDFSSGKHSHMWMGVERFYSMEYVYPRIPALIDHRCHNHSVFESPRSHHCMFQGLLVNLPSSCTEASVTSRKPSLNSTMNSTSSSERLFMNGVYSCKLPLTSQPCFLSCCQFTSASFEFATFPQV